MSAHRIRVLLAEGSAITRMFLAQLLDSDPALQVVAAVSDGQAAVDGVARYRPDVILMDIDMPRLDGFEATRAIMGSHAVPIVVCSAIPACGDVAIGFRAMEAGAIACVEKPLGPACRGFEVLAAQLLETVKLMSEVKVVRRTGRCPTPCAQVPPGTVQVVGIGSSTGGPAILQTIFAALPKDFPVPILVVQHLARGFLAGMAAWLNGSSSLRVELGAHGLLPLPGHVYLAPDDFHMTLGREGRIVLSREAPEEHLRPAASHLFRSLADVHGARAAGVMLSGMGRDGAAELKLMRDRGAVTIVQDRGSAAVYGMPGAAIEAGGALHVLPADRIAGQLIAIAGGGAARERH